MNLLGFFNSNWGSVCILGYFFLLSSKFYFNKLFLLILIVFNKLCILIFVINLSVIGSEFCFELDYYYNIYSLRLWEFLVVFFG